MPEVVVTKVTTQRSADADEGKESPMGPEDENKLQAPDKGGRIWNLLPVRGLIFVYASKNCRIKSAFCM